MATLGFYPAVSWGGPVKVVHQNALELQRRGHTVTVVASNLVDKWRRIESGTFQRTIDGLDVHYLHTRVIPQWPGTLGPTWLAPSANDRLRELVCTADVVHVNGTRNAVSFQAMRHAQSANKPLILQPHGTLPQIVNTIWLKRLFDRLLLQPRFAAVDAFIALQEKERDQIVTAGGDPLCIHVVSNGIMVDTGTLASLSGRFRARFNIPESAPIIMFLGRINRKKGTDLLVQAFARLPADLRQHMRLVIAGPDDGQLEEVEQLVDQYELHANVILPGLLEGEDVWPAHVDADLFVLPCRTDTFPMAVVEACAAGTPLVVTEALEIAGMLVDKAASVVAVDAGEIALAIRRILDDRELRRRYSRGARRLAEDAFSITAVGDALEEVYRKARSAS